MSRQDEPWRCATHESGHTVAAVNFGIPIIRVRIVHGHPPLHRAEALFCGPITDDSDLTDHAMARRYLEEHYGEAQLELQFARMRTAAQRLVASEQTEIAIIAAAVTASRHIERQQNH